MSVELILEVLKHAPAHLTPTEKLLLTVIAESCNPKTRMTWYRDGWDAEEVARRTNISASSLSKTFWSLAQKGCEVRVPHGQKDGKPIFAHRGKQTTFRLPRFTAERSDEDRGFPPAPDEKGPTVVGESPDEGRTFKAERSDEDRTLLLKALPSKNTSSLSPRETEQPSVADVPVPQAERENEDASQEPETQDPVTRMLLDAGCPTDQLDDTRKELTLRHQPRSNAWWRTVTKEGDLPALVADVLEALKPAPRLISTTEWRATVADEPDCPCGEPGGNLPRPPDGWMTCASCRRASGWTYQEPQPRTEDKHINGQHKPYRDPVDMAAYYDWSPITGKPVVRSPADQRLADAQPLYEKYKRQEMVASPGTTIRPGGTRLRLTDSRHPDRDYSEDF